MDFRGEDSSTLIVIPVQVADDTTGVDVNATQATDDESAYRGSVITGEVDGQHYEAHHLADGDIVVHLKGAEEEGALQELIQTSVVQEEETTEAIKEFLDSFDTTDSMGKKKRTEAKKFPCPKCEKVWNWPWELKRHVLTHFKEKKQMRGFKCEECGRGFQWKQDLAQHMKIHKGDKLLACSVCNKKFTKKQPLQHHMVVHTGEKPFHCTFCGKRFTQPANLRTHLKKKHE